MTETCLLVLCGLPASGKTSLIHRLRSHAPDGPAPGGYQTSSPYRTTGTQLGDCMSVPVNSGVLNPGTLANKNRLAVPKHSEASNVSSPIEKTDNCAENEPSQHKSQPQRDDAAPFTFRNGNRRNQFSWLHVCYDVLLPADQEEELLNLLHKAKVLQSGVGDETPPAATHDKHFESHWKSYRRGILECVDQLLADHLLGEKWHVTVDGNIPHALQSRFNVIMDELQVCICEKRPLVIVIDDNMYYTSMRYGYYQLARKYEIGFAELYFKCSKETALARNCSRDVQVLPSVIETMASKLEPPNTQNDWEMHMVWDAENQYDTENIDKIFSLVQRALDNPVQALEEPDLVLREECRIVCSTSLVHQSDQVLRKLVSHNIQQAKDKRGLSGTELSSVAKRLNEIRGTLLDDLRSGRVMVPQSFGHLQHAAKDATSPLFVFIQDLFDQRKATDR